MSTHATTDLSTFDNRWYQPGRSLLVRTLWFLLNALLMQARWLPSSGVRVRLLRWFGATVGQGVVIKPSVNIKYPWRLRIGNHVWIGEYAWIDNLADVTLGDHVCISQGAMLLTGNHDYKSTAFDLKIGAITLENGVWIGAKSVVCPGVTCRSHAVLAVGSVATGELVPYTIYQGNPAQAIRLRNLHL
ncbi:MAG: WcaF family extracellular polysaccharide biosynthesis acetyltransferase [Bacteroidia bacterium]|nr:WcaF family extracellular polysaccharide biosynthesis acetyltransferase [Bacteroidia bacterium]